MAHRFSAAETKALIERGWRAPTLADGFKNHGERVQTMVELAKRLGYGAKVGALQANFGTPTRTTSRGSRRSWRSRISIRPPRRAGGQAGRRGRRRQARQRRQSRLGARRSRRNDDGMVDQRDLEALDAAGGAGSDGGSGAPAAVSGRHPQRRAHGTCWCRSSEPAAALGRAAARCLRRGSTRIGALPGLTDRDVVLAAGLLQETLKPLPTARCAAGSTRTAAIRGRSPRPAPTSATRNLLPRLPGRAGAGRPDRTLSPFGLSRRRRRVALALTTAAPV